MNPVVHFEIPAKNTKRMVGFYESVFGWKTQNMGPDMGEYIMVTTTETDEQGMPKNAGAINGGFFEISDHAPLNSPSLVIQVDDINDAIKKVNETGGEVLGEPEEIPGVGQFVYFKDTEGNTVSILQPAPME